MYILYRISTPDYETVEEVLFASKSRKSLEDKISFLQKRDILLDEINVIYRNKMDLIYEELPNPPQPILWQLPVRDLVWERGAFHNAYMLEYGEVLRAVIDQRIALTNSIEKELAEQYDLSEDEIEEIRYKNTYEYSIGNVEEI